MARTDIDPDASVAWLETSEGEFKAPDNNDLSSLRYALGIYSIFLGVVVCWLP